ncbi:hypothetical protein MHYP_G00128670 [Metynnis hypsauchen]
MRLLLEELVRQPPLPLQWIGSEAWITEPDILRFNMCAGAIGFGILNAVIPGLREFLLDLSPEQALKSPLLTEFWESSFSCSLKGSSEGARECDGSEDIRALQNPYTDTSELRVTNLVYKATYAIAHAIHGVICNDTQCDKSAKFTPWQWAAMTHPDQGARSSVLVELSAGWEDKPRLSPAAGKGYLVGCGLWAEPEVPGIYMNGDYVIGGSFAVHYYMRLEQNTFTRQPLQLQCSGSMNFRELRFARAMEFTIHEINNRTDLLPGITLGYQIHDSCSEVPIAIKLAFQFANGMEPFVNDTDSCSKSAAAAVPALVGESPSTPSISIARILGLFGIPQAAQEEGICVEYSESYYRTQPRSKLERVANVIRRSTARVIVAFLHEGDMRFLMEELTRKPPPPLQWIGSEAWIIDPELLRFNMCAGAIGFGIPRSVIPGLREYLLDLSPEQALKSPLLTEFWESSFSCSLKGSSEGARECNGREDIRALQNPYTDTSQLRITNMVYKATYAIAHAIHGVICNDTQCDKSAKFTPWQILDELKRVNVTTRNGYQVSFDAKGDPVAVYELINWQFKKDGGLGFVTVGQYDSSKPRGQEFSMSRAISWMGGQTEVPRSVCSESCPPGTRKAVQKGKPVCCYDCIPCAEGEISNKTDSLNCVGCPPEFWPNSQRDSCLPKPVEFLSWDETLSFILTVFSITGAFIAKMQMSFGGYLM